MASRIDLALPWYTVDSPPDSLAVGRRLDAVLSTNWLGNVAVRGISLDGPSVMGEMIEDFYVGPPVDRGGLPLRIDLVMVYDLESLVEVDVPFHTGQACTTFRFADRSAKPSALRGLVSIGR